VARERVRQVTSHNVRGKEKLGETTFLRVIKNMRASAALKAMARLFASAWGRRYARLCMYVEHRRVEEWNLGTLPQLRKAQEVVARDSAGGTRLALAFSGVCRPSRGTNAGPSVVVSKGSEGNAKGTRREFEGNEAAGEREQQNGAF
jgi:hypothetical protein